MKKACGVTGIFLIFVALINPEIFASPTNQIASPALVNKSTTANPATLSLKQNQTNSGQKISEETKKIYLDRLKKNPNDEVTRLYLADYYLSKRHDLSALRVIKQGLRLNPNSLYLLMKLSDIQTYLTAYVPALQTNKKILTLDPQNKYAQDYFSDANKVIPQYAYGVNEVGLTTDNSYVTGFHQIWDSTSLYYTRDTNYGRFGGRVNYAARQGLNAPQYELDLSPVINRDLAFNLLATYSNQPELFPDYSYGGQANINLTNSLQFTGGAIYSNISPSFFMTYIAGFNKVVGNYLLSFIPYYFCSSNQHQITLIHWSD